MIGRNLLLRLMRSGGRDRRHQAQHLSATMYYTFCFSLPEGTDIYKLADSLLKSDVAAFATDARHGELRLAHRSKELMKTRTDAVALAAWSQVLNGEGSVRAWIRKHPKMALKIATSLMPILIKSKLRGGNGLSSTNESEAESDRNVADDTVQFIDDSMDKARVILGLRDAIDHRLYTPGYLEESPFIRLELESVYVTSEHFQNEPLEAYLLLHHSGVALLTLAIAAAGKLSTDDLLGIIESQSFGLVETRMPTSLSGRGRASNDATLEDQIESEMSEGLHWRRTAWRTPINLSDVFEVYQYNILKAANKKVEGRHSEWMCYPLLVTNGQSCCRNRNAWLKRHRGELAGLLLKAPGYGLLSEGVAEMLPPDDAINQGESQYFNLSHAVVVRWHFSQDAGPDMASDLWHLVPIESFLLQYWQIRELDWSISSSKWSSRSLPRLQEKLISGAVEYGRAKMTSSTADARVRRLLSESGCDKVYSRIMDRLNMLAQLLDAKSVEVSGRKNVLVASLGFLAAVAFGLPAINASIQALSNVSREGYFGDGLYALNEFFLSHPNANWLLYFTLTAIALLSVVITWRWRIDIERTKIGVRRPGIAWKPGDFEVVLEKPKFSHGQQVFDMSDTE
jgi:hypothetical protein